MSIKELLGIEFLPVFGARQGVNAERHNVQFTYDDLLNAESEIGRTLFGPIPLGHQREFFESKKNVWIWHENGITIRYEVRENGVFKQIGKGNYNKITGVELENFRNATKAYLKLVRTNLYK